MSKVFDNSVGALRKKHLNKSLHNIVKLMIKLCKYKVSDLVQIVIFFRKQ